MQNRQGRKPDSKTSALNQCHVGHAFTGSTTIKGEDAAGAASTADDAAFADDAASKCTATTDTKTNP